MKPLIILVIIACAQNFNGNYCLSQTTADSISFEGKLPKIVTKKEDLFIQLILNSFYKQRILRVPKMPAYCVDCDESADISFLVEEKKGVEFVKSLSPVDYSRVYDDTTCANLRYNEQVLINDFNLIGFFHFSKGFYRVKALFRLSKYNQRLKDMWTGWIEFDVPEDFKKPPFDVQ